MSEGDGRRLPDSITERHLPDFNDRPGYVKAQPLTDPYSYRIEDVMQEFLRSARERTGGPLRVLDIGCGRGEMVAQLLLEGWSAWGCDVLKVCVERGADYLKGAGLPTERLKRCRPDALPFSEDAFDVVVSNQVLEHVNDFHALASEVRRVSAPGAVGLHVFPGRRIFMEPHLGMPLVHWLAPGRARTALTRTAIRARWSVDHHDALSVADRVRVYLRYLDEQTSYRPASTIRSALEAVGLRTSMDYRASEEALARTVGARRKLLAAAGRTQLVGMTHLRTHRQ